MENVKENVPEKVEENTIENESIARGRGNREENESIKDEK
jgi:hypothetical protein